MTLDEHLRSLGACQEGMDFAGGKTAQEAWSTCERPDWLGWCLAKTNSEPENRRLAKLYCRILEEDITPLLPESKRHGFGEMLSAIRDWCEEHTEQNWRKARDLGLSASLSAALTLTLDSDRALAFAIELTLDRARVRARDLDLARNFDHPRDLDRAFARDRKWCNAIRAEFECPWNEPA